MSNYSKTCILTCFVFFSALPGAWASEARIRDYASIAEIRGEDPLAYYSRIGRAPSLISAWDDVIREVSLREGHDWRLLSAIAYNESRFEADVVSRRGACGLMQIMPRTARHFDVSSDRIMDPEANVTVAARLLTSIENMLGLPRSADAQDRLCMVLASYNGGIGHVADARRLARKYGANPNDWNDVAQYLTRKSDPEYLNDEVVKYGRFSGRETLAFVDNVIGKYRTYCHRYPH